MASVYNYVTTNRDTAELAAILLKLNKEQNLVNKSARLCKMRKRNVRCW